VLLGEAGEVVSPRDAAALAAAVARLLDMPASELQALGRKGQARVEREFSMDAVSRRYANLYEELMTRG
jgi:glycosyltransferase involved in cell wall biosynthesis